VKPRVGVEAAVLLPSLSEELPGKVLLFRWWEPEAPWPAETNGG
jgi:hypothetical protein